ncbi:diguanylate cyclase [Pseudoduganella sp.]|uniref:diguanylate cyclase n=1 Tax=Pseudoduganella sp. TaxID=1880898 RepID=UPI0035ADC837
MRLNATLRLTTAIVAVVVGVASTIPYLVDRRINEVIHELADLAKRERYYTVLLGMLGDAETGQRGYVITGDEAYLTPYEGALGMLPSLREQLRGRPRNAEEAESLRQIELAIDRKLAELGQTVNLRRQSGFEAAQAVVVQGKGKEQMDLLRSLVGEQISEYRLLRDELREQLLANTRTASNISIAAGIANILALCAVLVTAHTTSRKRRLAEAAAREASAALEARSQEAQRHNEQLAGSAQLMHALDMAQTLDESSEIISAYLSWLLPETTGTMYLYRNSRDLLERKASWGDDSAEPESLEPSECWGLRSGSAHFSQGEAGLHCKHVAHSLTAAPRLCVPLVSQGDVIGVVTVMGAIDRAWVERLSEQVAVSLSNVQLRLSLRRQSVVDPLTELYNRRFMDETLKRELARSARNGKPVAVVLVDLDHFKRVNDDFGHEAGDGLLREVGRILRESIRKCDIACRYGGEEMVLILPECDLENAMRRASEVREAIQSLVFSYQGRRVPATASFGVATTMEVVDAAPEALLAAADKALYHAKRTGRNRVCSVQDAAAKAGGHGEQPASLLHS